MDKSLNPTIRQANLLYLILVVTVLFGSAILQRVAGIGTNTWINELVYTLFPVLLPAWLKGWSLENDFRYKGIATHRVAIPLYMQAGE